MKKVAFPMIESKYFEEKLMYMRCLFSGSLVNTKKKKSQEIIPINCNFY